MNQKLVQVRLSVTYLNTCKITSYSKTFIQCNFSSIKQKTTNQIQYTFRILIAINKHLKSSVAIRTSQTYQKGITFRSPRQRGTEFLSLVPNTTHNPSTAGVHVTDKFQPGYGHATVMWTNMTSVQRQKNFDRNCRKSCVAIWYWFIYVGVKYWRIREKDMLHAYFVLYLYHSRLSSPGAQ